MYVEFLLEHVHVCSLKVVEFDMDINAFVLFCNKSRFNTEKYLVGTLLPNIFILSSHRTFYNFQCKMNLKHKQKKKIHSLTDKMCTYA